MSMRMLAMTPIVGNERGDSPIRYASVKRNIMVTEVRGRSRKILVVHKQGGYHRASQNVKLSRTSQGL